MTLFKLLARYNVYAQLQNIYNIAPLYPVHCMADDGTCIVLNKLLLFASLVSSRIFVFI